MFEGVQEVIDEMREVRRRNWIRAIGTSAFLIIAVAVMLWVAKKVMGA